MGTYDWRYSPECSGSPEYDPLCEVCGGIVDNNGCICPECPVCGEIGEPACYKKHGLIKTPAQNAQRAAVSKAWEAEAKANAEHLTQHPKSS